MNFNKFEVYGNPTLRQGGWVRTGADDAYIKYTTTTDPNYAYRICTLDYIPQHHPNQITITGIASKELEVSVLVLRSDNYIIASLGWQENGYTFNLGSTYDKLGVMFRFKNGDAITPNHVSFDIIEDWHDIPHYIHNTSTGTITTLPAVLYPNDTTATVGLKGNMSQSSTPSPSSPIQPQECGDLETTGEHAGQYKIPILNNSQTTNVYLGEVESTRRIKQLVLTGQENWTLYNNNYFSTITDSDSKNNNVCVCSHLISSSSAGIYMGSGTARLKVFSRDVSSVSSDVDTFKAWLANQYANGTPVTVWYVLAEPTTGIVNEPLRKIGDYADEVSGITIPTIAGANTLSIDTTLQPSEVTATYKGWHPVADVHERENGAWT